MKNAISLTCFIWGAVMFAVAAMIPGADSLIVALAILLLIVGFGVMLKRSGDL